MTYAEKCDTDIETIQYLTLVMKDDTIKLMMSRLDIDETINPWSAKVIIVNLKYDKGILLR